MATIWSSNVAGDGTPPPVTDLNHLCWECPLYIPARLHALATINRGPWPSSLRTWACPDPTPPDRAIELWGISCIRLQDLGFATPWDVQLHIRTPLTLPALEFRNRLA
ncbi:hypothetical protein HPB50_018531 [Hyalomma asiaticum]|uniref:Uncharacterized protein n=1 Tax=Hyalomma asiaticum TaxID=266040 RepID=A0ACB7TMP2_HYAAI|nr:hypothetical protein HPB50_018531 [Hyalomma asiaticum]